MVVWAEWLAIALVSSFSPYAPLIVDSIDADNPGKWNRPPNFLLVDYYNYGNFNGSVFEVAAEMNNVTYNGKCCGTTSAASILPGVNFMSTILLLAGVHMFTHLF